MKPDSSSVATLEQLETSSQEASESGSPRRTVSLQYNKAKYGNNYGITLEATLSESSSSLPFHLQARPQNQGNPFLGKPRLRR